MRVLVACEFSGIVRDAFLARGHDAVSCDLLPTELPGPHIQADIRTLDLAGYDLMIAHPPCTHITSAGYRRDTWGGPAQLEALDFVRFLLAAPPARICVENPARGAIGTQIRRSNQCVNPYQFGHKEQKATGLWLVNLPPLRPTNIIPNWARIEFVTAHAPGPNRWKDRARTFAGIADAMAEQWGAL